jgi:hypothetical protein
LEETQMFGNKRRLASGAPALIRKEPKNDAIISGMGRGAYEP